MGDGSPTDPVEVRKSLNALHADLTTLHFVDHENFELLGGPYGPGDAYKAKISLGPRTLSRDELWPVAPVGLQEAQTAKASEQGAAIRAYLAANRVKERFIYAYAIEKGKTPVFEYEIRIDAKGNVAFLDAKDFRAARPGADTETDAQYLARPAWKKTGKPFFQQRLPIGKHNHPVTWHFFGSTIRFVQAGVDELESDPRYFAPDPGYNHFAKDVKKIEGLESWELGRLVHVDDGVLVRVFDPLHLVDNMRKEMHARLDDFLVYAVPVGTGERRDKTERRLRVAMLANHVTLILRRSNKVDLKRDETVLASDIWPFLQGDCFTKEEKPFLGKNLAPLGALHGHEHFLEMDERLREDYLAKVNRAATKLMLFLSSEPWAFVERQYYTADEVTNVSGHHLLAVCATALERLGETDGGRAYLAAMLEQCEAAPGGTDTPNQRTLQEFVLRDKPDKPTLDHVKVVYTVGKAPFDLWSKLVSLVTAMNKSYLEELFKKHQPGLSAEAMAQIAKLGGQDEAFAASVFIMNARLRRIYGIILVHPQILRAEGVDDFLLFASGPKPTVVPRTFVVKLETPDSVVTDLDKANKHFKGKPENKLTFKHVSTVTGFIGLFFNMRGLWVAATEKGGLDITKSAFAVFQSVYGLPFVASAVQTKMANASLASLSGSMAKWVRARGVPAIGFVMQGVSVAFAAQETWDKAFHGQKEEVFSSAMNMAAQTLLLISAGMIVASGGVATPAAAALAAVAAVIAIGQYVYDLFRPGEVEFGLRLCLFGKGFYRGASPEESARVWQMCPNNDLRFFNPERPPPLRGYDTQLAAFSNLLHNYHVQIDFTAALGDTGAEITIFPGALPRDAYFEVRMRVGWWKRDRDGVIFDAPGDFWESDVAFRFHPFAEATPPLPEGAPATADYAKMRELGIVDPSGAPLSITPTRDPDRMKIRFDVQQGSVLRWNGKIENIFGGVKQPSKLTFRLPMKYEVKSTFVAGGKELRVRIDFDKATAPELTVDDVRVHAVYRRMIETVMIGEEPRTFSATLSRTTNPNGRERIEFSIPDLPADGGSDFELDRFELDVRYRDKLAPQSPAFGPGVGESILPGATIEPPEMLMEYTPDDLYHYRIEYDAELFHAGEAAHVRFRATSVTAQPAKGGLARSTTIVFAQLVLQYVRNEGAGDPFEEGRRGDEIFQAMVQQADGSYTMKNTNPKNGGSICLFDRLTVRFTAEMTLADGSSKFTEGDFTEDLKVEWSWPSDNEAGHFRDTALIKSVDARIRLVLDPAPNARIFLPNDISLSSREAFLEVKVDGSTFDMGWFPPTHRYEDVPGVGPPSSGIKAAIDACKTS